MFPFVQEVFNDTKITITGLNAVTTYRFQVFAENGVSALAGKSEYVDITVTTDASVPSLVSNVRITSVKSSELSISWDAPITEGGDSDLVERYEGKNRTRIPDPSNSRSILSSEVLSALRRRDQRHRHPDLGIVGDVQGPETVHGLRDTSSSENYARLGRVHACRLQEDASRYGIR